MSKMDEIRAGLEVGKVGVHGEIPNKEYAAGLLDASLQTLDQIKPMLEGMRRKLSCDCDYCECDKTDENARVSWEKGSNAAINQVIQALYGEDNERI